MTPIRPHASGCLLTLHVQPRASRTEVAGLHGDALKLRIAAPPVDGAANDEVVRFLAERLGVPRRDVRIAAGETGRRKAVEISGVDPAAAATALGL
ncbi:MAG: DUF167 domain-containing protein [Gemmatimonadales bacterium]